MVQRKNNAWLLRVCTLTTVAVLMICVWVPFDRLIAGFNVRQCAEISGQGVPIDLDYLQHLGIESLPALVWMQSQPVSEPLKVHLAEIDQQLRQQLHTDLENWRAWTVRRDRLARMFPPLQAPAP